MEIKKTVILDSSEPLSKALPQLDVTPAVLVTKNGKYYGMIDHRSVSQGIRDPSMTKCETVIAKPPVMLRNTGVIELVSAFMLGHFKALPVVEDDDTPLGITTRVEALKEMRSERILPKGKVSELMSTPVYSISDDETVGSLKRTFKEKNARRVVVTRRGNAVGVVSTFDIGAWAGRPNLKGGKKDVRLSQKLDIDEMPIKGFIRPDVTTLDKDKSLDEAAERMIRKGVSSIVVVSGKKAVGVLSALDIFKKVQQLADERTVIRISGLSEEQMGHYNHIKEKIGQVIEKFRGSFNIRNVSIHSKEKKATFTVSIRFDTDNGVISLRGERATLKETINELSDELDTILRRKKDARRTKPRASHYGGEAGTRYL